MSYKKYKNLSINKKNSSGAKKSFSNKALIARVQSQYTRGHNFHNGKNIYYGRLDPRNNKINVDEVFLREITSNGGKTVMCLNFVADAFEEMRRYIKIEAQKKLVPDNFITNDWDAKKGFASPHAFYDYKIKDMYDVFVRQTLLARGKEKEIYNFEDFIEIFLNEFYSNVDKMFPLTKSGMIMSKYFNPTNTGLCIEVSEESFSDGYSMISKYLRSGNYEFYTLAASSYGFLIDQNAPWRLIANLNSPKMQSYMSRYDLNRDEVFDVCYYKTYKYDINNLKVYLEQMYATYTSAFPIAIRENSRYDNQECPPYKQPKFSAIPRLKLTNEQFQSDYDDLFWLKLYYRIKLKEVGIRAEGSMLTREMIKLEQLYNSLDFDSTLDYINDTIKQQIVWF